MNASQDILTLLEEILDGRCDRWSLAEWLAEHSLKFLESPNEVDRMVVADLDAALGEIQRGALGNELLVETANQLVKGLRLFLHEGVIVIDLSGSSVDISTGSNNLGGSSMALAEMEPVTSLA